MDKIIKKVLDTLEKNNYKAYLVGGYVRDYLLGIKSLDVDICTDALPKDLLLLFPVNNNSNNYGGFNIQIKNYNIDITTFRKELKYENRKPTEIVYIANLEEDIKRRDFTINAICMDKNEKIIDLVNGVDDLNSRTIKMVGDIYSKLVDDPLRILRAIRFATVLDFKIDEQLEKCIKENYFLVKNLSKMRLKSEIDKILLHKNFQKGFDLLKEYKILDLLDISYDEIHYVNDICGMCAQIKFPSDWSFTKQEIRNIINIRQILTAGVINNHTLYKYGLYNNLVSADILNINRKVVNKMASKIPLKKESDLKITSEEIMQILNIAPSKKVKEIKKEIINLILDNKLKNNNKVLKEYVNKRKD